MGGVTRLEASVVSTGSQGVSTGNGGKQKSDGGESVEQHFDGDSLMLFRLKSPVLELILGSKDRGVLEARVEFRVESEVFGQRNRVAVARRRST